MTEISRRSFSRQSLALLGGLATLGGVGSAHALASTKGPVIGKVAPRSSKSIPASSLGIGFETLDRKLFDPEPCYPLLEQLGIKWARVQTGWSRCEAVKGEYTFEWLDVIVDRLLGIGIQPWFNVTYGNRLYMPQAPNVFAMGWAPNTEETLKPWLRYVRALAEHYRDRVRHWEIWNEPNIGGLWQPQEASAAGYAELVKATSPVIRENVPNAVVIGGALGDRNLMPFLKDCLAAGMADSVDRVSIHPYCLIPEESYPRDVKEMRALFAEHNPSVDLWQGECGCPSVPNMGSDVNRMPWTEARQARWLLRRIINDLRLEIEQTSWFNVADQVDYSASWRANASLTENPAAEVPVGQDGKIDTSKGIFFGLIRVPGYKPKPSYFAYQNLCALFDSRTETADVPLQFAGDFAGTEPAVSADTIEQASFARAACPLVAYWFPGNVMKDMATQAVDVTVSLKTGLTLRNPVLVDPLNGEVSKLEGTSSGGQWQFSALPLTDYPLLITDKAVALPS